MSERLIKNIEGHNNTHESISVNKNSEKLSFRHEHAEKLDDIRKAIEHNARSNEQNSQAVETKPKNYTHHYLTKKIKSLKYKETLQHISFKLNKRERRFSKIIHQPTMESISEVGSKTVARPSGIIGGGALALSGSLIIIIVAHRVGFAVSQSLFIVLYLVGFISGLLLEAIIKLLSKVLIKMKRHSF